jgi:peptidoglycan hydrolase CwlO-like protein
MNQAEEIKRLQAQIAWLNSQIDCQYEKLNKLNEHIKNLEQKPCPSCGMIDT